MIHFNYKDRKVAETPYAELNFFLSGAEIVLLIYVLW